jgi:RimJ/RimL family protein N-acetyltransferase
LPEAVLVNHPVDTKYACLSEQRYEDDAGYQLVGVQPAHIESIRIWRNAQMRILRQNAPIDPAQQAYYYQTEIWPSMKVLQPRQILFSYLYGPQHIGYGGLVHIDWIAKKAEVSVLFDGQERSASLYREQLSRYLTLLKHVAFNDLKLHRLWTEAYDIRPQFIDVLEDNGFLFEGRLKDHVFIDGKYTDTLFHGCISESP